MYELLNTKLLVLDTKGCQMYLIVKHAWLVFKRAHIFFHIGRSFEHSPGQSECEHRHSSASKNYRSTVPFSDHQQLQVIYGQQICDKSR